MVLSHAIKPPPHCHHTSVHSQLVANCQGQSHKEIPEVDSNTQVLLLNFNMLSTILNSSFPAMESLQMLSLGQQLGGSLFVGEKAFENVASITFLDLGGNRNLTLHSAAFAGLVRLEVLLLDVNGLDEGVLERGYFRDLVSLKRLDLVGNRIQRLRPDPTFHRLGRLSVLQLKLNKIGAICGDDLEHLEGHHLALLDLSSNRLSYDQVCDNPFHNITLKALDVSSNPWDVRQVEKFFLSLNGTQIQNLKMQHSGAIGSAFGFHNLKDISASTFSGLSKSGTFSLDMSHGFLNELTPSVFSALPDLHILLLSSNQITKIQKAAFAGLDQLRILDLSNNLLGELYTEALQSLKSSPLRQLILRSNHIGAVQHDALAALKSLQILDLQDNALSRVPIGNLPSLQRLVLGQNRLRDAWGIERLGPNLMHLDLSSNRLSDLGQLWGQLGALPNLLSLNLSSNLLASCVRVNEGPRQLRELDLSRNELAGVWKEGMCVDLFQNLERLSVMNLSRNSLQALPQGLFRGLGSLQVLDLSTNHLPMLPEKALQGLKSLHTLNLRENPMMTLSPATFQPLGLLHSLDLQKLSLLCHCELASFQSWLKDKRVKLSGIATGPSCILSTPPFREMSLPRFLQDRCS